MKVRIQPTTISGDIHAPVSKSAMQRACALALLNAGETRILFPGKSNDDLAALSIIQALGANVEFINEKEIVVNGIEDLENISDALIMNCGESGLSIRMFTPIAALMSAKLLITGAGSLVTRPMHFFDEVLPQLSVEVESQNGFLPLTIRGPLQPKDITLDGSLSSQFLTGILIAFAKVAKERITITVTNLKSKPYIDLTLQMMAHFGYKVTHQDYQSFEIYPSTIQDKPIRYSTEGDWSGGAFLLVAAAIAGKINVTGLDVFSAQADKAILQALMMAKATISINESEIHVQTKKLSPFHFNATDCPDLFPPLVALAAYCDGTSVIEGVSRLAHKESNRALTLQSEFDKLGTKITLQDDLMMIEGGTELNGATVHSHHDHRIVMALAIAGLRTSSPVIIEDADAINKSYPDFYEHLKILGVQVQEL